MPDTKISDLVAVTDVQAADEYVLARSGQNKKIDASDLLKVGYGTSLPGSPVDGQEYVLVDSITAPAYQWRFRYNSGASGSYKWEFVGGAPRTVYIHTAESTSSTTAVDLTTVGPTFTLPRAGDYNFSWSVTIVPASVQTWAVAELFQNGVLVANSPLGIANAPAAFYATGVADGLVVAALAASDVMKLMYRAGSATSIAFSNRSLSITPLRVS